MEDSQSVFRRLSSFCIAIISIPYVWISLKFWLLLLLGHTLRGFLPRLFFEFLNIFSYYFFTNISRFLSFNTGPYGSKNFKMLLLQQISPYLGNPCPQSENKLNFNPIGVERDCMWSLANGQVSFQIWQFWKSVCISESADRRAKMNSISTLRVEREYIFQLLELLVMAKFHAKIWQF